MFLYLCGNSDRHEEFIFSFLVCVFLIKIWIKRKEISVCHVMLINNNSVLENHVHDAFFQLGVDNFLSLILYFFMLLVLFGILVRGLHFFPIHFLFLLYLLW